MPTLPKRLFVVRAGVASLLRPSQHAGNLYADDDVAHALDAAAEVDGTDAIDRNVDVSLIVNAFAHDAADEYVLGYSNHFDYPRDKNVLYIRKFRKSGRHGGMRFTLLVGRFSSLEAARRAKVVRWNINIEEPVRDRLVQFLEEDSGPKVSKKKRAAAKVSPNDGGNEKRLCRAPLVAIQPPPPLTPERQGGGRATGDGTARLPSGLGQLLPPAQRAGKIAPPAPSFITSWTAG